MFVIAGTPPPLLGINVFRSKSKKLTGNNLTKTVILMAKKWYITVCYFIPANFAQLLHCMVNESRVVQYHGA